MKKYTIITPSLSLTANVLRRKVQCVGEFVSTNIVLIITSLINDWSFVLWGAVQRKLGKVNLNGGRGSLGAYCAVVWGLYAQIGCGTLGGFLLRLFWVCGALEPKLWGRRSNLRKFGSESKWSFFGPQRPQWFWLWEPSWPLKWLGSRTHTCEVGGLVFGVNALEGLQII